MDHLLLDAVGADTNGSDRLYPGGLTTFIVDGTDFGGGTVKLQVKAFGLGGYQDVADTLFTANGHINVTLGAGVTVRAILTGATSPDAVTAGLSGLV